MLPIKEFRTQNSEIRLNIAGINELLTNLLLTFYLHK